METKNLLSERGKKLLLFENYTFSKVNVLKDGRIRWRCSNRRCPSKMYTADDEETILEKNIYHNHEANTAVSRHAVRNSVKRKAVEELTGKPSKLIYKELQVRKII